MKNLFLDTNIILDLLGERDPFYSSAAQIATLADKGQISMVASALSFSTVHYLLSRIESDIVVREKLSKFKIICEVSDLTDKVIDKGLISKFSDFEDALQYHCALQASCDLIITRNGKDFKLSDLPVMTASEFLTSIKTS
jgi:predicted nucleic acid-binding protein